MINVIHSLHGIVAVTGPELRSEIPYTRTYNKLLLFFSLASYRYTPEMRGEIPYTRTYNKLLLFSSLTSYSYIPKMRGEVPYTIT